MLLGIPCTLVKVAAASFSPSLLEVIARKVGTPVELSFHDSPESVDVQRPESPLIPCLPAAASFVPSLLEAIASHT
jgi:hypothetical protein